MCLCVCLKIQFDNTLLVLMSTHRAHPPLGRYARLRDWATLLKNS